ncbi:MAG: dihydroorotase [Bacteroidota bacterium]|nr:dihydroorotase [Bacteroidota bacterium]
MSRYILIHKANIVNEGHILIGSVLLDGQKIKQIFPEGVVIPVDLLVTSKIIDAKGKYLIPGVIDDQVHFREPGLTHKGDIYSETRAAVAGGVTSFMDMPNVKPPTTTLSLLEEKYALAAGKSLINYSFYLGATNDNLEELLKTDPSNVCGIKVFMGSSTGNMLVDKPEALQKIFSEVKLPIAVHCEDEETIQKNLKDFRAKYGEDVPIACHSEIRSEEACFKSSSLAVELAKKYGTRLHLLHLSTGKELQLLDDTTDRRKKLITAETCVHYLWFTNDDYAEFGTRIKWNPAIKTAADREALLKGLLSGKIDVIATDHAPHTLDEKQNTYFKAPSGGPLVQHSLAVMLELFYQGKIPIETIVDKMCHAPADIFNINKRGYIKPGFYADLVLIDPNKKWTVAPENILYKCKWSPFEGTTFHAQVTHTFVNGNLIFENGTLNETSKGMRLLFNRSKH